MAGSEEISCPQESLPSDSVQQLLVARVVLEALLVRLQSFVVLLHEELDGPFSGVPLGEGRVKLDALLGVFQPLRQGPQLRVAGCPVAINLEIDINQRTREKGSRNLELGLNIKINRIAREES